jgi:hypothetical protein
VIASLRNKGQIAVNENAGGRGKCNRYRLLVGENGAIGNSDTRNGDTGNGDTSNTRTVPFPQGNGAILNGNGDTAMSPEGAEWLLNGKENGFRHRVFPTPEKIYLELMERTYPEEILSQIAMGASIQYHETCDAHGSFMRRGYRWRLGVAFEGLGRVNTKQEPECFHDQGKVDEAQEDHIEFLEAREDAAEALQSAKKPLHLIAFAVHGLVQLPRLETIGTGRHDGNIAKIEHQLQGGVVVVGGVHDQVQGRGQRADAGQEFAAVHRVRGLARGEREGYRGSSIRGNQMNLGGPSAAGFADGLPAVFFNAPVPSG